MIFLLFAALVASAIAIAVLWRFGVVVALVGASLAGATAIVLAGLYLWLVQRRSDAR